MNAIKTLKSIQHCYTNKKAQVNLSLSLQCSHCPQSIIIFIATLSDLHTTQMIRHAEFVSFISHNYQLITLLIFNLTVLLFFVTVNVVHEVSTYKHPLKLQPEINNYKID